MSVDPEPLEILHYVGYDDDRGGVVAVIRALATAGRFECVLGVNRGFAPRAPLPMRTMACAPVEGETLSVGTAARTFVVAREVQRWLRAGPNRIFHGHSRAGLAVALWLNLFGQRRAVVSVHCFGRQRGFYRSAARKLRGRLFWLTPAMRAYYGAPEEKNDSIPSCVPERDPLPGRRARASGNRTVFGGIGEIAPRKGWDLVLRALAALPPALRAKAEFRHIGSATNAAASRAYERELLRWGEAMGPAVAWQGEQASSDAFLLEIDCLVVPSYDEPFSLAMLEAWQARVPVLRADSGGAANLIVPDVNGWRFRTGDAADLAAHLQRLIESDALERIDITDEMIRPYTAPVVAERWEQVYRSLRH